MKYEIGQKVETPFGKGVVTFLSNIGDDEIDSVWVSFKNVPEIEFSINVIKPYKTPHEKLLDMGFRQSQNTLVNNTLYTIYEINGGSIVIIEGKENYYKTKMKLDLKLSRILTEYLEWLEEEK